MLAKVRRALTGALPPLQLQTKLTLFAALLVLSAVSVTSLVAWQLLDQLAESAVRARLDHAAEVVAREYDDLLGDARITAEAIAAWPLQDRQRMGDSVGSLAAVLARSPFLQNAFRTRSADLIVLVGPDATAIVELERGQPPIRGATYAHDEAITRALAGRATEGLEIAGDSARAVVALPIQSGDETAAAVLVASFLDDGLADRLKAATAFDVTFYAADRAIATSARALAGARQSDDAADPALVARVVTQGQVVEQVQRAAGHRVIVRYYPLAGIDGSPVGMFSISAPVALLFETRTQVLAVLAIVVAVVLVVALAAGAYFAQALSRPLRALVEAARRIGEGDLTSPVSHSGADEVGLLAGAMEDMRLRLRKHAEEQAQLDRLKDQYLFNVAHELKTPLAALAASVQVLAEDDATLPEDERRHLVGVVQRSTMRFQTLVDNLLDLGSLRAGRLNISPRPVAFGEVAAEAIASMLPLLDARRQRVECILPESSLVVLADARRLQQVLVNLLANATKYGPDGDVIRLQAERLDGQVRVAVTDHGPGIAEAEQAHLFEAYFRSAMAQQLTPGVGLGLAIVKAVVEAHGGEAGIDSLPGRGTTVWFTLPVAVPESNRPAPEADPRCGTPATESEGAVV